jgi:hypothetical protein
VGVAGGVDTGSVGKWLFPHSSSSSLLKGRVMDEPLSDFSFSFQQSCISSKPLNIYLNPLRII